MANRHVQIADKICSSKTNELTPRLTDFTSSLVIPYSVPVTGAGVLVQIPR